ncbi:uncharacterized protein LOC135143855 [Zophobas morio]|uniref:uncharacterized protein LOC135143855 n=1 Tax=Zophobas morio TaxID=2755281 RepID=UPI003083DAE4
MPQTSTFQKITTTRQLSLSESAVWGTISTGNGHFQMEEIFSTIGVKIIDQKTFSKIEMNLGKVWHEILFESMMETGEEEKRLAIESGDVTSDGTHFITVIVDGGWSHRSYGHRYTANSGVACVIGKRTKKLLHLDVRNKYCAMCLYRKKQNMTEGHENCFKNWNGSSAAMEADMLVQAFRQSKTFHGLEYRRFIGDGDSSVFARLYEKVSYGRNIEKLECANHAIKNYTKALCKVQGVSKIIRSVLTPGVVRRLKIGARCAIIHNSKENQNPEILKEDLRNGPAHVFGIHKNCKNYFCHSDKSEKVLTDNELAAYNYVHECLKPLLRKAPRLVTNDTSNLAENFMSLVAKFVGGKQIDCGKRGAYTIRARSAGLDFQYGPMWHYNSMKKVIEKSPSCLVKRLGEKRLKKQSNTRRSLFNSGKPRRKVKNNNDGCKDYGESCHKLDLDEEEFKKEKEQFLKNIAISCKEEQDKIEETTRGQRENEEWFIQRKNRLTASLFGSVVKRRKSSSWAKLVEQICYKSLINCPAINYGILNEKTAITAYQEKTKNVVVECGLFVDLENGFLAASPDGLIGENGILEVKCPKSAENLTVEEASKTLKQFYIDKKQGCLKRTHNYFYQVQGQLHISNREFCDFVVWTRKDLYVEGIFKDDNFWQNKMFPKLKYFYHEALLPELVDPRKCRNMPLREPNKNILF